MSSHLMVLLVPVVGPVPPSVVWVPAGMRKIIQRIKMEIIFNNL